MKLRRLKEKDASRMYEWMQDSNVTEFLSDKFKEKKLEDCIKFIKESNNDSSDLNRAVVDEQDIYMGTVSLKHIDLQVKTAEFAIVMHPEAIGTGIAQSAMKQIIDWGFDKLQLERDRKSVV